MGSILSSERQNRKRAYDEIQKDDPEDAEKVVEIPKRLVNR